MDDFDLWELVTEHPEVFEAHELPDAEPHYEPPAPIQAAWCVPFGGCHDSYTVY